MPTSGLGPIGPSRNLTTLLDPYRRAGTRANSKRPRNRRAALPNSHYGQFGPVQPTSGRVSPLSIGATRVDGISAESGNARLIVDFGRRLDSHLGGLFSLINTARTIDCSVTRMKYGN